jgi:phage tail sheath protein FI
VVTGGAVVAGTVVGDAVGGAAVVGGKVVIVTGAVVVVAWRPDETCGVEDVACVPVPQAASNPAAIASEATAGNPCRRRTLPLESFALFGVP